MDFDPSHSLILSHDLCSGIIGTTTLRRLYRYGLIDTEGGYCRGGTVRPRAYPGFEWVRASGRGTVYSVTNCHLAAARFEDAVPYNLVLVELEEVRMMSNIVDCPNEDIEIR